MTFEEFIALVTIAGLAIVFTVPCLIALIEAVKYKDGENACISMSFGLPAAIFWAIFFWGMTQ